MNFATDTAFTGGTNAPAQPPLSPEEIAPHFPQLEILECLGRGGMGVVYKARQKALNRLVALKLLAPEREKDAQFAERFAREAQALAALSHSHIVTIHDFGQTNGFFYLLMEYVDGVNLRQLLGARKLSPEEALAIVPPLCEALQFAHERGIVHRDIKPENLLLDKEGRVKIADFGIAKMLGADAAEEQAAGTPGYMAPEQKETPQRVDSRADIYSIGVVFYEMLTGELPADKLQPPSRKVQVDVRIDEIVLRALEKAPELRFQTATEMRTRVEAVANERAPAHETGSGESDNTRVSPAATSVQHASIPHLNQTRNPWKKPALWAAAAIGCVLVLLGIGGNMLSRRQPSEKGSFLAHPTPRNDGRTFNLTFDYNKEVSEKGPFSADPKTRYDGLASNVAFTYSQVRLDGKSLTFDYTASVNAHWSVWLRSTTWQRSSRAGEPERIVGEETQALSAPRGVAAIKNLDADPARDVQATFDATNRAPQGVTVHLQPARTEKLFDLKLVGDQRVSFEVELQPNPIATAQPAFQVYVRELSVDRDGGTASASYEIVEAPGGFDLVLETTGANLSEVSRDGTVLTPVPFKDPTAELTLSRLELDRDAARLERLKASAETERLRGLGDESGAQVAALQAGIAEKREQSIEKEIASAKAPPVMRTLLTGRGERLQWRFMSNDRATAIFISEPVRGYVLTPTTLLTLFSFTDVATGHATSATIKMVPQPFDPKQLLPAPVRPTAPADKKPTGSSREESGGTPSPAGASAADTKMQDLAIQTAEYEAAGARALAKERLGGREDVMRAERNLAIAKARGDAIEIARIQVAHAEFERNGMAALHKEKMASKADAVAAELALQKARLELEKALAGKVKPGTSE